MNKKEDEISRGAAVNPDGGTCSFSKDNGSCRFSENNGSDNSCTFSKDNDRDDFCTSSKDNDRDDFCTFSKGNDRDDSCTFSKDNGSDGACNAGKRVRYPDIYPDQGATRLKEPAVAYGRRKQQGEYTIEDYYALPDDMHAELIDGVIYDMAAPHFGHQSIVVGLLTAFHNYIRGKQGKCRVVASPIDVQLDQNDRTMVQPDLLILCDKKKLKDGIIFGAPDLVAEVLSPSTQRKDRTIKLRKYREAGVREYWIIDMNRKEVEVYLFQSPELATLPKVYHFDSVIPVGIYGGDCKVDFSEISRDIWDM